MDLLDALARALDHPETALTPIRTNGLAHDFVRLDGRGVLARVPRFSPAFLAPETALAREAAGFARASASGRAPALRGVLKPTPDLPRGVLLVEEVGGRPPSLPGDLPALAESLARIHALPLPAAAGRPPLAEDTDPLGAMFEDVQARLPLLEQAGMAKDSRALFEAEMAELAGQRSRLAAAGAQRRLILSDTHPGNFVVRADGTAMMVDAEKACYGLSMIDVAHATLPTSTLWDPACARMLTPGDCAAFHAAYARTLEALGEAALQEWSRLWLRPARRLVWLRTTSFFALWRVQLANQASLAPHHRRHVERVIDRAFARSFMEQVRALNDDPVTLAMEARGQASAPWR